MAALGAADDPVTGHQAQKRLSSDAPRLSPTMKYMPSGTVAGRGRSQAWPRHARTYDSATGFPFRMVRPDRNATWSPGPATMRLTNSTSDRPAAAVAHA